MWKFFVGLAVGALGGAAVGAGVAVKVGAKNPRIQRAIGQAIADKMIDFVYGSEDDPRARRRYIPTTPYTRYDR